MSGDPRNPCPTRHQQVELSAFMLESAQKIMIVGPDVDYVSKLQTENAGQAYSAGIVHQIGNT